jgi:rhodanese-related sulfurtransferase
MVREGAMRVDVRTEAEFEESGVKSALNLPMYLLRLRLPKLNRKKKYILYCDTGTRSAAAGFIMRQQGYDVYVLKGGLAANTPQSSA